MIPLERSEPSFDVTTLLNGYEPLFSLLNPRDADNLTKGVIQSLQGDEGSIAALVNQTSQLTASFAGRDDELGAVITDLNAVMGNLARYNDSLDQVLTQAQSAVTTFNGRRQELVDATGSMSRVVRQLSVITDEVYPSLNQLVTREPGFAQHMVGIEPQLAFTGANLPLLLKGFARITGEGAYANAYACDLNATGFFPGLNDVVPIVVDAATPATMPATPRSAGTWRMADEKRVGRQRLESYHAAWLGTAAIAVVVVLIGAMLLVKSTNAGYRTYTAQFLQAAALRPATR